MFPLSLTTCYASLQLHVAKIAFWKDSQETLFFMWTIFSVDRISREHLYRVRDSIFTIQALTFTELCAGYT
jgi:hypothetical protein